MGCQLFGLLEFQTGRRRLMIQGTRLCANSAVPRYVFDLMTERNYNENSGKLTVSSQRIPMGLT